MQKTTKRDFDINSPDVREAMDGTKCYIWYIDNQTVQVFAKTLEEAQAVLVRFSQTPPTIVRDLAFVLATAAETFPGFSSDVVFDNVLALQERLGLPDTNHFQEEG